MQSIDRKDLVPTGLVDNAETIARTLIGGAAFSAGGKIGQGAGVKETLEGIGKGEYVVVKGKYGAGVDKQGIPYEEFSTKKLHRSASRTINTHVEKMIKHSRSAAAIGKKSYEGGNSLRTHFAFAQGRANLNKFGQIRHETDNEPSGYTTGAERRAERAARKQTYLENKLNNIGMKQQTTNDMESGEPKKQIENEGSQTEQKEQENE